MNPTRVGADPIKAADEGWLDSVASPSL